MLFLVYVFNFIDRTILTILLEPIKRDLGISDTAMGFLTGFAFAAFYTVAGIPIARWADRGVRRSIIAMGLAAWSVLTALSGLAQNFAQLALARVGVGVGERRPAALRRIRSCPTTSRSSSAPPRSRSTTPASTSAS